MKSFITGVAGFLGSHIADHLLAQGNEVVGCDNLFCGTLENIDPRVEFHNHDITILHDFARIMHGCDVVYHCAAAAYEGASVFAPSFISDNIYTGSATVFSAALQAKASRIVYCSSMARYGMNAVPFQEAMLPKPQDPYGIAKEAAERLLMTLGEAHDIQYVVAVPHNIYGPKQRYCDPYRNVAAIMANLMLQGRQPYIYGDGTQMRSFSYIDDVVGCLTRMATDTAVLGEVINIGPDEDFITINDLAQRLANIIGFDLKPTYMPDRPMEVKLATCSADKARMLLDYQTRTSLDDGLRSLVEHIKERGPKNFVYHFSLEAINDTTPRTWIENLF